MEIDKQLLQQIKRYIENVEQEIDSEWGSCRNLDELLRDKAMPCIYYQIRILLDE